MPVLIAMLAAALLAVPGEVLKVGPGFAYARPEAALAAAKPGDVIEIVAPAGEEMVLSRVALRITTPSITVRANGHVVLDGDGFSYSGAGPVPRAIVQVDREGTGAVIEGLVLRNAHNESGNGAGVRINAADSVTVRRCEVLGCDMGVMSDGAAGQARGQRFESCEIHGNGSEKMTGLSHNLYLGGEEVTLENCVIRDSTRGHNLKSRARVLRAIGCRISGSAEREVDLVDSELTGDGGDAHLEDCDIVKRRDMTGNRAVIHFGQDGGQPRRGVLTLNRCCITTYYVSPVVTLSSPGARCVMLDCRVDNPDQKKADLVAVNQGEAAGRAGGHGNRLAPCYDASALGDSPTR